MKTRKAAPRPSKAAHNCSRTARFSAAAALIAAFLFALAVMPRAMRAEGKKACFEMNSIDNVAPGDEFKVTLDMTGDFAIQAANLGIVFDPSALELKDVEQGDLLTSVIPSSSGFFILEHESIAAEGIIKLGITMIVDPLSTNGRLMTMTFRVKEGVKTNQQIVMNVYQLVGPIPIGEIHGDPCEYETKNAIVRISGGADPQESFNLGQSGTPVPGFTPPPTYIDDTSEPVLPTFQIKPLPTIGPNWGGSSSDPSASGDPSESTSDPSALPDGQAPGSADGQDDPSRAVSPIVYVAAAAAALAVCAGIVLLVKKNGTKKAGTAGDKPQNAAAPESGSNKNANTDEKADKDK